MSAPALRPLRIGEILDAGLSVYRRNARTLMGLSATVVVPFQALSAVVLLSTVSRAGEVPRETFSIGSSRPDHAASVGANAILTLAGAIVTVLVTAACVKAVSDIYLDQPATVGASLRFALRRVGALLLLEILTLLGLAIAFLALVVPGVWLYAAWSVAVPALLIEGCRGSGALRRSFRLVRKRWWHVAGVLVVASLMTSIVSGAIEGALLALMLSGAASLTLTVILVSLTGAVASVLTRPFQAAVTTVLYYDL
ncbi:MAG TPA: hypothetical protein VKV16_07775, partial [Solirubrobacteraceae bacterium]|nr:hypothetical protein [Solirubrobacteraceae bacterium]